MHTDVGNKAVGAKINGKIAPLASELGNGDEVEIVTDKTQISPPAAWESIVVTGKARAAIRRATRVAVRTQYAGLGRRMVERLFARAKKEYSDEKLQGALPRLARGSIEDVMSAVGRGEMRGSDVARAMYPDYKDDRSKLPAPKSDSGWFGLKKALPLKFRVPETEGPAIPIRGTNSDLPVSFAPESGAVPGDRIVGILTPGEGITIYPIQSPALKAFDDDSARWRWLDVRWDVDEKTPERFPARIKVQTVNEPGSLAQVTQVIAEHDGNIDNIRMARSAPDFTELLIDLEVYDLKHLNGDYRSIAREAGRSSRRARSTARRLSNKDSRMDQLPYLRLGVNIDHVATIRNARGGAYPDPVEAAHVAIAAGADGITAHLREDRRHIRDEDIARLRHIEKP